MPSKTFKYTITDPQECIIKDYISKQIITIQTKEIYWIFTYIIGSCAPLNSSCKSVSVRSGLNLSPLTPLPQPPLPPSPR